MLSRHFSYGSSKVDYSMREAIYVLPSDINLSIRSGTAGYNNEILVSDSGFSLGRTQSIFECQRSQVIGHVSFQSIPPCQGLLSKKFTPQPAKWNSCTKKKKCLDTHSG